MGAGKTTVGSIVAGEVGYELFDSDPWVEAHHGLTAREFAAEHGVPALHDAEARMLTDVLDTHDRLVVTPAASVVDRADLRKRLRLDCTTFFLDLPFELMRTRMESARHRRSLDDDELIELSRRRAPLFTEVAVATLDATAPPGQLAATIVEHCHKNRGADR